MQTHLSTDPQKNTKTSKISDNYNRNNPSGNNLSKTIGIIMMVLGLVIALYSGFNNTINEEVVEARAVQLTMDSENTVNWGLYAGIGFIVIGGVVYFVGRKNNNYVQA